MNLFKNKNNVITYTVNKNDYNNLYISVQNGEVIINAPWNMGAFQIQKIVEEKKQWILNRIKEYEKSCENKKEYIKLDTIKVLGYDYDLAIRYKMVKSPELSIEKERILVTLPYKYKKLENSKLIEMLIKKMYDIVSKKEIERIMEKTRIMTGLAPEDYKIRRINGTIAKCINSKITINPDIAKYSREVIEYIVLHEFCHLRYKNHTKSFYGMIEAYIPNYEDLESKIKGVKF